MREKIFFSPFPITDEHGAIPQGGILQKISPACKGIYGQKCINHYKEMKPGFIECPYGFSSFKFKFNKKNFIWSSIKISSYYNPKKINSLSGTSNLRLYYEREINSYLAEQKNISSEMEERISSATSEAVSLEKQKLIRAEVLTTLAFHEVRPLTARVKAAAHGAISSLGTIKKDIKSNLYDSIKDKLDSIRQAANLVSVRMDMRDFLINPDFLPGMLNSYNLRKEIDKVILLVTQSIKKDTVDFSNNVDHSYTVSSFNIFSIALFVIFENAVKYSPVNQQINIEAFEQNMLLTILVRSLGPKITNDEKNSIFLELVRGKAATGAGIEGSGFGLYLAQIIAKKCNMKIRVEQYPTSRFTLNEIDFYDTSFEIMVKDDSFGKS